MTLTKSIQNKITLTLTVIPYINNLQTSTEQLVLNPLTHKWKSCASPKVTKTWHNLFKKRYCLSSNSAVTDLLKGMLRKNYKFNDVLESRFCGNLGKLYKTGNFLLLNMEFFCCQVKMTEHQTTLFHVFLLYFSTSQ